MAKAVELYSELEPQGSGAPPLPALPPSFSQLQDGFGGEGVALSVEVSSIATARAKEAGKAGDAGGVVGKNVSALPFLPHLVSMAGVSSQHSVMPGHCW